MWKTARSLLVVALIAIPVSDGFAADQPDFTLCKSTYALCTTAPCTPVAGQPSALVTGMPPRTHKGPEQSSTGSSIRPMDGS